ncbi:MAG TPA: hypothetical protein VGM30_05605 [Puia sp.]|jgi:hypothetical protein
MRRYSLTFFFSCVLLATILFDDPHKYLAKRIIYLVCLALSIYQLYLFRYKRPETVVDLPTPRWYRIWIQCLIGFTCLALFMDLRNPQFSLITIVNHPLALLTIVPMFSFQLGYQTIDIDKFIKFLLVTAILFGILFLFPISFQNFQGASTALCYAVLPLSLFAMDRKKYRLVAILMIVLSIAMSQVTDARTIILRILIFFGLLVAMSTVKKWSSLKLLVVLITGFMIYQFLVNLQAWLDLFTSFVKLKGFDDQDTRTFIYEEVFGDMRPAEMIFGRGFLGTYFSPYFLANTQDLDGDYYYRFSAEVGFLQLLLKGGLVYFLLYITPLVAVVRRGLFTRHKSRIGFYISVYILCELLILFIENIPSYHFQFFIIFFLAGYGYRQTVLEATTAPNREVYHNTNTLLQPGALY